MSADAMADCSLPLDAPLVLGFGVTGGAVVDALVRRGHVPVVVEDRPGDQARDRARSLGIELVESPDESELARIVGECTAVLPSPGIPDHHPIFAAARESGRPILSEFDLAAAWDERPVVAITGTNGKTTVTMMVTDALERSGRRAAAVGNTETPLVEAIEDPATDVFVVECSSFRLAHSRRFAPDVAAWLNFAPDHLDAHATLEDYRAAKASIFAHLGPEATAVVAAEDDVVMAARPSIPGVVSFGLDIGDWRVEEGHLIGPNGPLVALDRLSRRQPHDLRNAAAAAAIGIAAGATEAGVVAMLESFSGLPHRVQFVAEIDGVAWYNDSKATVPHATLAAVGGFESVVLIAGGRNKGLDLSGLADAVPPIRAVVATGDAAPEIHAIFSSLVPVVMASSMGDAVAAAAELAQPGDTALLSPSCTSYDWYPNYGARGEHFVALVKERTP